MTSRNICLLIVLGLFLTFTFTGILSNAQSRSKFKVHVRVSCDDENTKSLIQSWTKRELRNLGDVVIVRFDDAQYILAIVAVEEFYQATGRKSGGISIGVMLTQRAGLDTGHYYYPDFSVVNWSTKHLEHLCKDLVADVDTRRLEPVRELFN